MLRTVSDTSTLWESVSPAELLGLPAELDKGDRLLREQLLSLRMLVQPGRVKGRSLSAIHNTGRPSVVTTELYATH